MVVICEKCKKRYRVDPAKIKGKAASFNCHICSHVVMVYKAPATPPHPDSGIKVKSTTKSIEHPAADGADPKDGKPSTQKTNAGTRHHHRAGGFGLRTKMLLLFFFIPSILTVGMGLYFLWHFETTSGLLVQEIIKIDNHRAKESADLSAVTAMIHSQTRAITSKARMMPLAMLGATILLIGIIVLVYANRLSGRIDSLTNFADRISAGKLEMEIETKSRDEIGELTQAIARLRDNIRLHIERLQQRP